MAFSFLISASAYAQPCFYALSTSGCVPFTVNIISCATVSSGTGNVQYGYTGNIVGLNVTSSLSFTYTAPGVYSIRQSGNFLGGQTQLLKSNYITVLDKPTPTYTVRSCNNKEVRIYPSGPYQKYSLDFGDGSAVQTINSGSFFSHVYSDFSTRTLTLSGIYVPSNCGTSTIFTYTPNPDLVKPELKGLSVRRKSASSADLTISFVALPYIRYELLKKATADISYTTVADLKNQNGITNYTFSDLPYFNQNYCFKISAKDTCGNTLDSQELCDVSLGVTAKNQYNALVFGFPPLDSLKSFNVYSNGALITSYTGSNFSTSYNHTNLICNQRYCYNTVSIYKPNDYISSSDTVCVKATSTNTPPSVTNLFSTITTNSPFVSWSFTGTIMPKRVYLERSADNASYTVIDSLSAFSFMDKSIDASNQYYYRMKYVDSCGNTSLYSNVTSPIKLIKNNALGNAISLSWTDYIGYTVKEYLVEKRDPLGNIFYSYNAGKTKYFSETPTDTVSQKFYYYIKAIPSNSSFSSSSSNEIEMVLLPKLLIPNAFTPNGDGLNDVFLPKTLFITNFKMTLFNKLGEPVFSTTNKNNGWDGKLNGQDAPVGVYAFTIEASDPLGNKLSERGTFSLIK